MEITMMIIVTMIALAITVALGYIRRAAETGEPFSIWKTIIVFLLAIGFIVFNVLTNNVLLTEAEVWQQVAVIVAILFGTNQAVRVVAAKSETVQKAVSTLEHVPITKYAGTKAYQDNQAAGLDMAAGDGNEMKIYDPGFIVEPAEQTGNSPFIASFSLTCSTLRSGPNRVVDAIVDFGDGAIETVPITGGYVQFKHTYVYNGGLPYASKGFDVNVLLRLESGVAKSLNHDGQHAVKVYVNRP